MTFSMLPSHRLTQAQSWLWFGFLCFCAFAILGDYQDTFVAACKDKAVCWPTGAFLYKALHILLLAAFAGCLFKGRAAQFDPLPVTPTVAKLDPIDPLLVLRAFACFLVLFGHSFLVAFPPVGLKDRMIEGSWLWLLVSSPWAGVWVFFTLSGYLMGKGFFTGRYPMSGAGFLRFYRNRLYRVVPVYLFVVLVVTVLVQPEILDMTKLRTVLASLITFDYPQVPVALFWSIGTEMHFYMLAPFLCLVLFRPMRQHIWLTILFMLGMWGVAVVYRHHVYAAGGLERFFGSTPFRNIISNLDIFLTGLLANLVIEKMRGCLPVKWLLPVGLLCMATIYVVVSYISNGAVVAGNNRDLMLFITLMPTLTAILTALAIICFELAREQNALGSLWTRTVLKGLQPLGTLTFCIYCWHEPVLLSLRKVLIVNGGARQSIAYAMIAWAFTGILSVITYRTIELPFDQKRKKLLAMTKAGSQ